nr:hypothetical protein [uncultured Prevotella sp.]
MRTRPPFSARAKWAAGQYYAVTTGLPTFAKRKVCGEWLSVEDRTRRATLPASWQ